MAFGKASVFGLAASLSMALLAGCTSSAHHTTPTTSASAPAPSSSSVPPVIAPLLPGASLSSSSGPWSVAYAASQFEDLLDQFNSASGGQSITSSSSFADYLQYSQNIADACDPFLTGLREGQWPAKAELTIVQYMRLQQVVCDVELARGQAGTISEYQGVQPPPANTDSQLLALRLKIYKLLGI